MKSANKSTDFLQIKIYLLHLKLKKLTSHKAKVEFLLKKHAKICRIA